MSKYAADTSVSAEASRAEIERTLRRYGATAFAYAWEANRAMIAFEMDGRRLRLILPLPNLAEFKYTPARQLLRSSVEQKKAHEQAVRQRWRALALYIKATLEAVEAGIITLEEAMLAATMLPDGRSVGQFMLPQIARAYESGHMPPMLPAPPPE